LTTLDEADLRELHAVFLLDAPGRLERIAGHLDELERARLPPERAAAAAAAAHDAHSLTGAARTLRLEPLATHSERLELVLRADDSSGGALPERARDLLAAARRAVDALEADAATAEPSSTPAPAAPQRTVLHVEDNPVNVKLIERALARRPAVRLLTATSAEAGLRLAETCRPDLVLLDLRLPDAPGGEFLSRLRAAPATAHVPVVVVSATTPSQNDGSLRRLGVREYLTKPVDIGRLLELVDELAPTAIAGAGTNGGRR